MIISGFEDLIMLRDWGAGGIMQAPPFYG